MNLWMCHNREGILPGSQMTIPDVGSSSSSPSPWSSWKMQHTTISVPTLTTEFHFFS